MKTKRCIRKVVVVTGAGSGIGRASALLLASQGATVICADLVLAAVKETAEAARNSGGLAVEQQLDVTSESQCEQELGRCWERHGRLDALVNCAGISFAAPVTELKLEDWDRVMAVNLDGVYLGTKHAIRLMRRAGQGGSIVNVSSASGLKAAPDASAYAASKAAVCMFTKTVAKECIEQGDSIRVNAVCPAGVKTPMWRTMPFFQELVRQAGSEEAAFQSMAKQLLHRRFAEPEEIAEAILYLVSDESSYVTGIDLLIDGGYTL